MDPGPGKGTSVRPLQYASVEGGRERAGAERRLGGTTEPGRLDLPAVGTTPCNGSPVPVLWASVS